MKRTWQDIAAQYERIKDAKVPAPPSVSLQTWIDDVGTLLDQIKRKEQPSLIKMLDMHEGK